MAGEITIGNFGYVRTPNLDNPGAHQTSGVVIDFSPIERALQQAVQVHGQQIESARHTKFALALSEANLKAQKASQSFLNDPDPATAPDRYNKMAEDIRNEYTKKIQEEGSTDRIDEFNAEFNNHTIGYHYALQQTATRSLQDQQVATLNRTLDNFGSLAGSGSTEQYNQNKLLAFGAIAEAVATRSITNVEASNLEMDFKTKANAARVQNDSYQNPAGTLQRLQRGDYEDLDPKSRGTWIHANQEELKQRANEARIAADRARAERDRQQEELRASLRVVMGDWEAAAADGKTLDPAERQKITAAFKPDVAQAMIARLDTMRDTAHATDMFRTFSEDEIKKVMDSKAPEGAGYEAEAKGHEQMRIAAAAVQRERKEEPAGSVIAAFPTIAAMYASGDDAQMTAAMRMSADIQTNTFGMDKTKVQLLTKPQADNIAERFKQATTVEQKMEALAPFTIGLHDEQLADITMRQLAEKGVPYDAVRAMDALNKGDTQRAKDILNGLESKVGASDLKDEETKTAVKDALNGGIAEGATGANATLAMITGNSAYINRVQADQTLIEKLTYQNTLAGMDADAAHAKAKQTIEGDNNYINDAAFGVVKLKPTDDQGKLKLGLTKIREALPTDPATVARIAANLQTQLKDVDPTITSQGAVHLVETWGQEGKWMNEPNGDGFVLMVQVPTHNTAGIVTGSVWKALPDETGKAMIITREQATKAQEVVPVEPPIGTVTDPLSGGYDPLSGGSGEDRLGATRGMQAPVGGNPANAAALAIQRLSGKAQATQSADIKMTEAEARALGIPSNRSKKKGS